MSVLKGSYFNKKIPDKFIYTALVACVIFWRHDVMQVTFSQCYFPITNFDISSVLKMMVATDFVFPKKCSGHQNPQINND